MEIVPGIHQAQIPLEGNPLGYVNTYLIAGDEGWTLIDTGWNDQVSFEAFERQLKDIGADFKDINLIIITHIHPDHFGLAGRLKQLSGATLAIHRLEKAAIDSRYLWTDLLLEQMGEWLRTNGVPASDIPTLQRASMGVLSLVASGIPDQSLFGGETISTGLFDLRVLWTPGHSAGHVCLYEPSRKILFAGDHILSETTPNISLHVQSGANPLGDYIESLSMLRSLDVDLALPAHEFKITNLQKRIDEILRHHDERTKEILKTLATEPKTAYQIASEIPWMEGHAVWSELDAIDKRAAVTETLAHLEALRIENKVEKITETDFVFYKAR